MENVSGQGVKIFGIESIAERREFVRGFIIAVFRISEIVEAAVSVLEPQGIDITLLDLSAPESEQLLYAHPSRTRTDGINIDENRLNYRPDEYTVIIEVGGRTWSIIGSATPYFMESRQGLTEWIILIAGLAFAGLLGIYIVVTTKQAEEMRVAEVALLQVHNELEQRVEERTRDLQVVQEELLKQSRLATLGKLTATVSHELRNPLGTALTSIDFLQQQLQNQEQAKSTYAAMNRLERAIVRCDRIIDELLDYTRLRVREQKSIDLDTFLAAYLNEHMLPEDVVLERKLEGQGVKIMVDEELLRRVLINIIDNACQAMANSTEEKWLIVMSEVRNDLCRILIKDNGPGMTAEVRENIFDPLFSTKTYGIGLGMAIVKQIMEQLHGDVQVESKPGQGGTEVSLWLPMS